MLYYLQLIRDLKSMALSPIYTLKIKLNLGIQHRKSNFCIQKKILKFQQDKQELVQAISIRL